jgi:cyclophilin family peptidyl-prolyl cis-trans isomerase
MKRVLSLIAVASLLMAVGCGNNNSGNKSTEEQEEPADSVAVQTKAMTTNDKIAAMPAEPVFDIVTSEGTIKVRLYADTPKHRENFARLAFSGFYDRTLFHRVINNFMIQGGDPLTTNIENQPKFGTGGPGYQIPAEILPNHHHKKGALAAARKGDVANPMKESSGSQFYIVQSEEGCRHLDGEYTIFGETIDGFAVIDKIAAMPTDGRGLPLEQVKIISIKYDTELN